MPSTALTSTKNALTRPQKAAVLVGVLGRDNARPFLESLDETALRQFASAMATLRKVRPETVYLVIEEFLDELEGMGLTVSGGRETLRALLKDHVSDSMIDRIMAEMDTNHQHDVWQDIVAAPAEALANVLKQEHPQIASVVLARLSSEKAAQILTNFNAEHAQDTILALHDSHNLKPDVMAEIGRVLYQALLATGGPRPVPRTDRIGGIMNFTPGPMREQILSHIAAKNPDAETAIRRKMFTFEDIAARIQPRDIGAIAQALDEPTLLRALVGAEKNAAASRDFFFNNMSKRMAAQMQDSMAELGSVKLAESDQAQLDVLRTIRALADSGAITLLEPENDAKD